jgi:hydrogenase nickel incorporation protein HypB
MAKFSADRRSDLPLRIIELKESILEDNDKDAQALRDTLHARGTCLLNLMSGPGSGKTSTLLALQPYLEGKLRWGVMEADIDSDVDAKTLLAAGIPAVQLHTGGMCHLDADMTRQGLAALAGITNPALGNPGFESPRFDDPGLEDTRPEVPGLDLVVLENIGNLVCPAEFDTGAAINMTILSVPEGDDKPAKYPLMYEICDLMVVNKIDAMPVFDFDTEKVERYAKLRNPKIKIFYISAKTSEGVAALAEEIVSRVAAWNA